MKDLFPFTASNGYVIERGTVGMLSLFAHGVLRGEVTSGKEFALREFFQAERDASLGRWRSKEHPEWVAYIEPDQAGDHTFLNERTGGLKYFRPGMPIHLYPAPAREFFAAHPEPKPWHDAKPGERWMLTIYGAEHEFFIRSDGGTSIFAHRLDTSAEYKITGDTGVITAGRRIWPEGGDES